MQNLIKAIMQAGLTEEQAIKSLNATYQWADEHYPVLATLSRSTVLEMTSTDRDNSRQAMPQ